MYVCMDVCCVLYIVENKVSMVCQMWVVFILGDWKDISLYKFGKMKVFFFFRSKNIFFKYRGSLSYYSFLLQENIIIVKI